MSDQNLLETPEEEFDRLCQEHIQQRWGEIRKAPLRTKEEEAESQRFWASLLGQN